MNFNAMNLTYKLPGKLITSMGGELKQLPGVEQKSVSISSTKMRKEVSPIGMKRAFV
jgi:hypothetical protein